MHLGQLGTWVSANRGGFEVDGHILGYPHHWQVPAATEKCAYETLCAADIPADFDYLGIAWATLIDGIRSDAPATWELLRALNAVCATPPRPGRRRATVAQHIHADLFIEFFSACGITDLFWSHATVDRPEIDGIRVHPFPLFPAQTPEGPEPGAEIHRPRRHLANFIGAYNPKAYLTDVRARIFDDAGTAEDLLIVKREGWHFERAVYVEQMKGEAPDAVRLKIEAQHKAEYLDAIRESLFTLCPTGSGPNSIRIGEALALASIPVILTRDLALPGDPALWEAACLIEDDNAEGYRRALVRMRAMPAEEIRARQAATQSLFAAVGPANWASIIMDALASPRRG